MIELSSNQKMAMDMLKTGSILCGGVGSGKSRTAIAYYFVKVCGGSIAINGEGEFLPMKRPKNLFIITTARKRDTLEWECECSPFLLSTNQSISFCGVKVVIDSWNNIGKYIGIKDSFFIFDEQRVVGSGAWVKSFLKISKNNKWILLSATPGDTWTDYIPVFVANGFYKNRTEFLRRHAIYSRYTKFPKIDHYVDCGHLSKLRQQILVIMHYEKKTIDHHETIMVQYDKVLFDVISKKRWNAFEGKPIKDIAEMCYLMRKVVNSDPRRVDTVKNLILKNSKTIIFYNFNYELDLLRKLCFDIGIFCAEWNGQNHNPVPEGDSWVYLVQYAAGAEGWNCIKTNCMIFYSQNYSYKVTIQSAGRIDRRNTPFSDLYYFHVKSNSLIDIAISKSLERKKSFNELKFFREKTSR